MSLSREFYIDAYNKNVKEIDSLRNRLQSAEAKLKKIREYAEELKDLVSDDEYRFGQEVGNQILAMLDSKKEAK